MATWSDRVRNRLNRLQDRVVAFEQDGGLAGVAERMQARLQQKEQQLSAGRHALNPEYQTQVRLWYARLELPYGADADAVRQAFRRLMRRYHPDRFTSDPDAERAATEVSQKLAVAYEGLLEYLNA